MVNRKVIMTLLTFGLLAVVASAGTYAYFATSIEVKDNTITAGKLDLSTTPTIYPFTFGPIIPGDSGSKDFSVKNNGTVGGTLYAKLDGVSGALIPDVTYTINSKPCTLGNYVEIGAFGIGEGNVNVGYNFPKMNKAQDGQGNAATFKVTFLLKTAD